MRTITLLTHGRPELLEPVLNGLLRCQDLSNFDRLIISIDPGSENEALMLRAAGEAAKLLSSKAISTSVITCPKNVGTDAHHLLALRHVFDDLKSDLNVELEDDALLKPDALRLALWFEKSNFTVCGESCLISMCNHRAFGKRQLPDIPDDPTLLAESPYITAPFAWATTRFHWPFLRKWWGFKKLPPNTFSFSISMAMRLNKKLSIHPVVSRCQNIGPTGVHETPESFSETQEGLIYQEEPFEGRYALRCRMDLQDLQNLDEWMIPEWNQIQADKAKSRESNECF